MTGKITIEGVQQIVCPQCGLVVLNNVPQVLCDDPDTDEIMEWVAHGFKLEKCFYCKLKDNITNIDIYYN